MEHLLVADSKDTNAEIIVVDDSADGVSCDGGGGALGHPKVWYSFDGGEIAECGYCDRRFIKESAVAAMKRRV
jgi:uncharacterized Zn-finger protein